MAKIICLLAAGLALISSGAAYSSSKAKPAAKPRTLVSAKGPILAFAQDGDQIAWASDFPAPDGLTAGRSTVRMRLLAKHRQRVIATLGPDSHGTDVWPADGGFLVLAGKRTLWWGEECHGAGLNECDRWLTTGSYATRTHGVSPADKDEGYFYDSYWIYGDVLTGAADSSTIVYGHVVIDLVGPDNCDLNETCEHVIKDGGINRVVGTEAIPIPGAPPPFLMAVSGRRVAVVAADSVAAAYGRSPVLPGSPAQVVVLDAVSGDSIASFTLEGKPEAIAFSPSVVGALTSGSGGKQIELYTPVGEPIRMVAVPVGATGLSMSSTRAVFQVGRSIRTVGIESGAVKTIATAASTPIGLSIEGSRIAWAENFTVENYRRGRIRAITVR